MGATNVAWVWSPWKAEAFDDYYPGDVYVDWIGLTLLNYGSAAAGDSWLSFEEIYAPFRAPLERRHKPILLAEFGSTPYGGDQTAWLVDALGALETSHPEIGGVVFFHSNSDRNWPTSWRPTPHTEGVEWQFIAPGDEVSPLSTAIGSLARNREFYQPHTTVQLGGAPARTRIAGAPGAYELIVDSEPFYIRGVAYNRGEGPSSGSVEPTRRVIDADFNDIVRLGANTVRRYGSSWADRNLLHAADAHGLKIMMGFWLDPSVDYLVDTKQLAEYEARIVASVKSYRDQPAVLSWTVGNETWGLLKHHFSQPYLTLVRSAYVEFVERMARRIKELDPARPVFTSLEFSAELPGALTAFTRAAQSVDALGINAYYARHLADIGRQVQVFAGSKPYLISEFGPDGYWDASETKWSIDGFALEPGDRVKARQYAERWRRFVAHGSGQNLGGVAFTWADRHEGSYTWFGLTDFKGRYKAAYFALQNAWLSEAADTQPPAIFDLAINLDTAQKKPGNTIVARLASPQSIDDATINWLLLDEATYEDAGLIDESNDGLAATVQLPKKAGRYRLYVFVGKGKSVATASLPVLVN